MEDYVPATRGLAVALRRCSLSAEGTTLSQEVNRSDWESERKGSRLGLGLGSTGNDVHEIRQ